ncbi:MAG TPA: AAA family ATPase [Gemmatimonadales bacterium]|nr:AAA family ATPase [Gemmatimonadales bacterium]
MSDHTDLALDYLAAGDVDPNPTDDVPAAAPGERRGRAQVVTLADVEVTRVDWLWPGRLAFGKLNLLEGHPGIGKSTLTMELAARVSRGQALPGGAAMAAADVLLLSAEDGLGDTVRPRLEAAGGDPSRVHVLTGIQVDTDGEIVRFPGLPDDIGPISAEVERRGVRLVIIDPLGAYLGEHINSWRDADVRRALTPLALLAERTGAAVLAVRHLNKTTTGRAITAGGGSIGIIGVARCGLLVATDPEDSARRILAVVKNNLSQHPPALTFTLAETEGGWARITWGGTSAHTADDLVAADAEPGERSKLDEAMDLLREWLADGPVLATEVQRLARENSIADKTLRRAKERLRIESLPHGAKRERKWSWQLPAAGLGGQSCPRDHLSRNPRVTAGSDEASIDGHDEWPSMDPDLVAINAPATPVGPARPCCNLCGGPLLRRRSGVTRCPSCAGASARDPFVEPLPSGVAGEA